MRHLLLAALAVLPACATFEPFKPAGACVVQGFGSVFVEDDRDCYCVTKQVELAMSMLTADGAPMSPEDGARLFPEAAVWIHASDGRLVDSQDAMAWARYVPGPGDSGDVETERYNRSLVHELLHHYEIKVLHVDPSKAGEHTGWKERGWIALDDRYWNTVSPGAKLACY